MYSFQSLHNAIYLNGTNNFTFKKRGTLDQAISWHELQKDYLTLAHELKKMDLGENPVIAILSSTRYEWNVIDFATQAISGITVGLYKNDRDSAIRENIKQANPSLIVVESYDELKRIQSIDSDWGWNKPVIIMDAPFQSAPPIYHLNSLLSKTLKVSDRTKLDLDIKQQSDERIASYIFTSGTSGQPKATVLTIKNLMHSAHTYRDSYHVTDQDSTILYLPFSHVFARVMFYSSILWGQQHYYVSNMDNLADDLKRIGPSVFLVVPRLLEKVKKAIQDQAVKQGRIKHALFNFALKVGRLKNNQSRNSIVIRGLYALSDRVILKKIRAAFGSRIRFMGAGGGKLSSQVAEFFWSIGIPIYEGYASTESGGLGVFNYPHNVVLGSIGKEHDSCKLRLAEDGELQIKSPSNALGYLVNGKIEPFNEWISTGDIITQDSNGFLSVIDRKKDIMVTSNGKNIAPSWIEEQFSQSNYIDDLVIAGDERPFISALIVPSPSISDSDQIERIIENEINRINRKLSRHERIRSYTIIPEFDISSSTMTATFKKRRSAILKHYQSEIDCMYLDSNQAISVLAQ